jgi:2-haloacid dehalogenase
MRLRDVKALSFDCYGTLIDWEKGLLGALRPWLERSGVSPADDEVLEVYADCEHECQAKMPKAPYPVILSHAHAMLGEHFNIPSELKDRDAFGASIGSWPPFPDTADALRYLKTRCKLIVLSNVDNASFSKSRKLIGVKFDAVYTAEVIGSYKPNLANFRYLIDYLRSDFGVMPAEHLHVAQSLFHDHIPAKELGLNTCWIDRRAGKEGGGATKVPKGAVTPDVRFESLAELAVAHRKECA